MPRRPFAALLAFAASGLLLAGCASVTHPQAQIDQPLPGHLQTAMTSELPTFAVGDELGWLAFGDLALAPLPGQPTDVLVIVRAEPVEPEAYDWVDRYLALAH